MALLLRLFDAAGNQITGGSTIPGFEGCIDVLEWSWAGNFSPENLLNVTFKKSFDGATVPLLDKANRGEVLSANLFDIDTSNPNTTPQRVDLDGVRVQQVEVAGRSAPPSEEGVILRYNVIKFYSPTQADSVVLGVR
jgi:type VI protein secretion system component Hcp